MAGMEAAAAVLEDSDEDLVEELEIDDNLEKDEDEEDEGNEEDDDGMLGGKFDEGVRGKGEVVNGSEARVEVMEVVEDSGAFVDGIDEVEIVAVAGACSIVAMVARASGAGAAHVSFVAMEHWTPMVASLLQQAHRPVVTLYTISG